MTCKDCIYCEVCPTWNDYNDTLYEDGEYCGGFKKFKNKAEFVETKHGKWVYDHWCEFKCSECGHLSNSSPYKGQENFCPNCGAKMDGVKSLSDACSMTKREFWLKLFSENDTALASAIHLCERFVSEESLESGKEFIREKVKQLDEEVSEVVVRTVFCK